MPGVIWELYEQWRDIDTMYISKSSSKYILSCYMFAPQMATILLVGGFLIDIFW